MLAVACPSILLHDLHVAPAAMARDAAHRYASVLRRRVESAHVRLRRGTSTVVLVAVSGLREKGCPFPSA